MIFSQEYKMIITGAVAGGAGFSLKLDGGGSGLEAATGASLDRDEFNEKFPMCVSRTGIFEVWKIFSHFLTCSMKYRLFC